MQDDDRHDECSVWDERCQAGDEATCPKAEPRKERARERAKAGPEWGKLIARREPLNGWRHYLDGEPVHCGSAIELQAVEDRYDDYGDYSVPRQTGAVVRYEANLHGAQPHATLHASVAGYEFVSRLEDWMRFRWPGGKR
jgi:hypothetical protein